jgi:hypothetical protein
MNWHFQLTLTSKRWLTVAMDMNLGRSLKILFVSNNLLPVVQSVPFMNFNHMETGLLF